MRIWHNAPGNPREVSLDLLCFILSSKRRKLQNLTKKGILKKASYRSFFLTESVKGYIAYLKKQGKWGGDEALSLRISELLSEIEENKENFIREV